MAFLVNFSRGGSVAGVAVAVSVSLIKFYLEARKPGTENKLLDSLGKTCPGFIAPNRFPNSMFRIKSKVFLGFPAS
jgi:hypothetical protein